MVESGDSVVQEDGSHACYKGDVFVRRMMGVVRRKIAKSFFKDRIVEELFNVVSLVL